MAPADPGQERSGRDLLVEWANKQDHWVRAVVAEVLSTRRMLTDQDISRFHDMMLREKELAEGDRIDVPSLGDAGAMTAAEESLVLTKLASVKNVNALAAEQEIAFNPNLTVLFGENGAGKSGYVRVLKAVASVRNAEPILPDVRKAGAGKPAATITFRLGDKEDTLAWGGEQGLRPLTRLDVFDSRGLVLHVDEDLTYVYSPGDVALFQIVHAGAEAVRKRLEDERSRRKPQGNLFVDSFPRDAALFAKIEALGAATNIAELEALANVSPSEEQEIPNLQQQVDALSGQVGNDRLRLVREETDLFRRVRTAWDAVARFPCAKYSEAISRRAEALRKDQQEGAASLESDRIPGVLTQPWRDFVEAAERYIKQVEHEHYPAEGAACAYCRQRLDDASRALLTKYRTFTNNQHKRDAEAAEREVVALARGTVNVDAAHLDEELRRWSKQKGVESTPVLTESLAFVQALAAAQDGLRQLGPSTGALASLQTSTVGARLDEHLRALTEVEQACVTQVAEREKLRRETLPKLRQLEARVVLRNSMPGIRRHVEDAQWVDRAGKVAQRFQGMMRSLTDAAKTASEQLLNQGFEHRFRAECEKLKAPTVTLEFPGRKGAPARRKSISAHRLSDILSEGEQKVIALADFLAEATLRTVASPIILDDPITSLDYKRLSYVVGRIVELSRGRQVVLFTHNIWFTMELLAQFDRSDRARVSYFDVSADNGSRGLVSPASSPRLDSWSDKSKRINRLIESAKKQTDRETRDALVEKGYEDLRGACEVVVEQDMLQKTVQSYAPNVMVAKLKDINVSALPKAIESICDVHDRCCRFIGSHKQPLETLNVRPTLEGLQKDWKSIEDVHAILAGGRA